MDKVWKAPRREPRLQVGNPVARIAIGAVVAVCMLAFGAFVFGPVSDGVALNLAGGAAAVPTTEGQAEAALADVARSLSGSPAAAPKKVASAQRDGAPPAALR